ncbi:MAG: purine-nucleoside phosphorylase [Elusimicrobiota bacterium]
MKINKYVQTVRRAASYIKKRANGFKPDIIVVLGSGLAGASPDLENKKLVAYKDIPGFPKPTVSGHSGRLLLGQAGKGRRKRNVAVMQGRFHYYEGHAMESIALPIRALEYLGARTLIATSAVGSMIKNLQPGDICVIKDHMNFMGRNPLRAFHEEEFGDMFPDLVNAYTPALRKKALAVCRRLKIHALEGVYTAVGGPSYETPAEIKAFAKLGGSVVGMSVIPETIVARQMGMDIMALSWISNMAAGTSKEVLSHPDVLALGEKMAVRMRNVLNGAIAQI